VSGAEVIQQSGQLRPVHYEAAGGLDGEPVVSPELARGPVGAIAAGAVHHREHRIQHTQPGWIVIRHAVLTDVDCTPLSLHHPVKLLIAPSARGGTDAS
jgi:hypothetical protein